MFPPGMDPNEMVRELERAKQKAKELDDFKR
jgi:hypothetical protein